MNSMLEKFHLIILSFFLNSHNLFSMDKNPIQLKKDGFNFIKIECDDKNSGIIIKNDNPRVSFDCEGYGMNFPNAITIDSKIPLSDIKFQYQGEVGFVISDEGQILDLTDEINWIGQWQELRKDNNNKFLLPKIQFKNDELPKLSPEIIISAIKKEAGDGKYAQPWLDRAKECKHSVGPSCYFVPFNYKIRLLLKLNGNWQEYRTFNLSLPISS